MDNELVVGDVFPVEVISNKSIAVDGRLLWEFLGKDMNKLYRDLPRAIENAILDDGVDYCLSQTPDLVNGGRPRNDWVFTADAAKEIAMMSNRVKGKEIRKYFIDIEKIKIPNTKLEWMKLAVKSEEEKIILKIEIEKNKKKVNLVNHFTADSKTRSIGEWANMLNAKDCIIGRGKLFKWLLQNKYIMDNKRPYQKYLAKRYFSYSIKAKNANINSYRLFVTTLGISELSETIVKDFTLRVV